MKRKEGFDIKTLAGLGIAFVIIAIILSFGSTILSETKDAVRDKSTADTEITINASQAVTQNAVYTLEKFENYCSISNFVAVNNTFKVMSASNYSISGCSLTWLGSTEAKVNLSYKTTYYSGTAVNATVDGLEGLEEFSSWLPTLALIIVAAVIIGIIVAYFGFGGIR